MTDLRTSSDSLAVAVVTGGHSFEVPAYARLWRDLDGIDAYVQSLEDWSDDVAGVRDEYDAVVFYNMHTFTPTGDEPWPMTKAKAALEALGETRQGIVIWHHALVAFPDWPYWRELTAIDKVVIDVSFNETMPIAVVDPGHPITSGVRAFDIVDETYAMADPSGDIHALLTAEHPKSMNVVGWTSKHRNARVFCLQLGHDGKAWAQPELQTLLRNGIMWTANSSQGSEFV